MNRKALLTVFLAAAILGGGCSFELSSPVDQEIKRLEVDIETLLKHKAQLASVVEDIAELNRNLEEKREELKIFKSEYPDAAKAVDSMEN